ncbi:hypothetical protein [Pseudonocardia broussonetiae]|uniref:RraA family protein n=1 Tax=Pseudonocardia broussonetiae TaxID=2736640 RepID=UPI001F036077|nr:hypothetical protein [Pseudonocardia broussonetiae]
MQELTTLGMSVLAAGLCVPRAHMRLTSIGAPVQVAGLQVAPGDLVHGDQHGVLRIPREHARRLAAVADEIRAEEQEIVGWARSADFSAKGLLALRRVRH